MSHGIWNFKSIMQNFNYKLNISIHPIFHIKFHTKFLFLQFCVFILRLFRDSLNHKKKKKGIFHIPNSSPYPFLLKKRVNSKIF